MDTYASNRRIDNAEVWALLESMKSIYSTLFIDKHGQVKSVRKDGCAFDPAVCRSKLTD